MLSYLGVTLQTIIISHKIPSNQMQCNISFAVITLYMLIAKYGQYLTTNVLYLKYKDAKLLD